MLCMAYVFIFYLVYFALEIKKTFYMEHLIV
jgi:hypothetical protein